MEVMSDNSQDSKLYLVTAVVKPTSGGVELMKTFDKIKNNMQGYSNWTKVLYRFKVTGEPQAIAVVEVYNVIGLERSMAGLSLVGNVKVTCQPIIPYEVFARSLGVGEQLLNHIPLNVDFDGDFYLMETKVDQHDMSTDQLMQIWKEEATFILTARNGGLNTIMYKIVGERKVVMFVRDTVEMLDKLSFKLPLMTGAGGNVQIRFRGIQDLATYTKNIVS